MQRSTWKFLLATLPALVALVALCGCGEEREHRKVRVMEEQREGEVREAPQGDMIVE